MAKTQFHQIYMKAARERRAKALARKLQGATYEEIGKEFGVTRQRAQLIVKRAQEEAAEA